MCGRVGMGAGLMRVDGDVRTQAVVERLRSSVGGQCGGAACLA